MYMMAQNNWTSTPAPLAVNGIVKYALGGAERWYAHCFFLNSLPFAVWVTARKPFDVDWLIDSFSQCCFLFVGKRFHSMLINRFFRSAQFAVWVKRKPFDVDWLIDSCSQRRFLFVGKRIHSMLINRFFFSVLFAVWGRGKIVYWLIDTFSLCRLPYRGRGNHSILIDWFFLSVPFPVCGKTNPFDID